jgi:hypothetical protein
LGQDLIGNNFLLTRWHLAGRSRFLLTTWHLAGRSRFSISKPTPNGLHHATVPSQYPTPHAMPPKIPEGNDKHRYNAVEAAKLELSGLTCISQLLYCDPKTVQVNGPEHFQ